ncbi:hypothetical protein [Luxibacter massiliensis]|uniref:hypothetical protein n=1 Tax=Luxibacter massiliensis TaxID=2219695 RepID=UPI000F05C13C|nr:hypothetical protein [Luxibacter massiliensis]
MNSMFGVISIMVLCCGIYGLYAYFKMRKDGRINEVLLLGKGYTENQCKDKAAFLQKAMPAVLVFGIITTLYGVIDTVNYYVTPITYIDFGAMIVFLIMLAWFMAYTTKLKNKYFK